MQSLCICSFCHANDVLSVRANVRKVWLLFVISRKDVMMGLYKYGQQFNIWLFWRHPMLTFLLIDISIVDSLGINISRLCMP